MSKPGPTKTFILRTRTEGAAGKAVQAAGVALGPTRRFVEPGDETWIRT